MGYYIYASLDEGKPCLQVVDAESRQTCLSWHCDCAPGLDEKRASEEMHRLFRKLLLLSCQQELSAKCAVRHASPTAPAVGNVPVDHDERS